MDYRDIELSKLKNWFERFAENECKQISPFYYNLSKRIALDDEIIKIAAYSKQGQPMPNLFLASIHYLLLMNPSEALAKYYPSINKRCEAAIPFALFKDFCDKNRQAIIILLQSKIVQTNALNRSAYLMPILSSLFDSQTINLIDIGASAGLNLNFGQYEYHYNGAHFFGESSVKITSEIKEGKMPTVNQMVKVNKKIGIDQNPLDLNEPSSANWLKSLIWPDQTERFEKMEQAIKLFKLADIQLKQANSILEFEHIIDQQEDSIPLVIYHTHVLYQFPQEERKQFWNLMDRVGNKRDLCYLATESHTILRNNYGLEGILIELTEYRNQKKQSKILAQTNGHANWIKWI